MISNNMFPLNNLLRNHTMRRPEDNSHEYPATPDQAFNTQEDNTPEYIVSHDPGTLNINNVNINNVNDNDYSASFRVTPTSIKTLFINGPKKGEVEDVQSTFRHYECYSLPEPELTKPFEYSEYRKESTFIVNEKGKLEEFIHWQQKPNETRADKLELIKYELIPITVNRDDYEEITVNFAYIKPLPFPPNGIYELIESNFNLVRREIQDILHNLQNYLDRNNWEYGSITGQQIAQQIAHQMRMNRDQYMDQMNRILWMNNDDSNSLDVGNGIYNQINQSNTTTYSTPTSEDMSYVSTILEELSNT